MNTERVTMLIDGEWTDVELLTAGPPDCRDLRERDLALFGGELELAAHKLALAAARAGLPDQSWRRPHRRPNDDARALTIRAAARRLGVARPTLQRLIAEGWVRTVPWVGRVAGTVPVGGRVRIPAAEVERVAQEGILPEQAEPKKARAAPTGTALPRIRDLDY